MAETLIDVRRKMAEAYLQLSELRVQQHLRDLVPLAVQLMIEDRPDTEIARRLNMSKSTVRAWRRRLGIRKYEVTYEECRRIYEVLKQAGRPVTVHQLLDLLGLPVSFSLYHRVRRRMAMLESRNLVVSWAKGRSRLYQAVNTDFPDLQKFVLYRKNI